MAKEKTLKIKRRWSRKGKIGLTCAGIVLLFLVIIIIGVIVAWGTPSLAKIKSPTNQSPILISGSTAYKESKVEIYLDGNAVSELNSDKQGKFSTEIELKEEKEYKIKAQVTNKKGKTKEGSEMSVIYDKTPPVPPVLKDYPAQTEQNKIEISAEAEKNCEVVLFRENEKIKSEKSGEEGKIKFSDIELKEGENKFRATAIDEAGNRSQESEVVVIIFNKKTETQKEEVKKEEPTPTPTQKYPSLTEETMDRNCILNCLGGDEVALWDKPTSAAEGARLRDKVPCGTFGWAFNKYHNEELNVTFYAINTLDSRVKTAYGWITEDLITWRE